jgi:hypothetical protein
MQLLPLTFLAPTQASWNVHALRKTADRGRREGQVPREEGIGGATDKPSKLCARYGSSSIWNRLACQ